MTLLGTNKQRLQKAITEKAGNAILVKPNQIGTISETVEVIAMAKKSNWKVIVSHRSGETNDDFIADFAVGWGTSYPGLALLLWGEHVAPNTIACYKLSRKPSPNLLHAHFLILGNLLLIPAPDH